MLNITPVATVTGWIETLDVKLSNYSWQHKQFAEVGRDSVSTMCMWSHRQFEKSYLSTRHGSYLNHPFSSFRNSGDCPYLSIISSSKIRTGWEDTIRKKLPSLHRGGVS